MKEKELKDWNVGNLKTMRSSKEIISKVEQYCFCENKENQKRLDEAFTKKIQKENVEKRRRKNKWV